MKKIVLLGLVACVSLSYGSYDLLLIGDSSLYSDGSHRIHRFDGETGSYFGSFRVATPPYYLAANRAYGDVYYSSGVGFFRNNYSQGATSGYFQTSNTINGLAMSPDDQILYTLSAGNIYRTSTASLNARTLFIDLTANILRFAVSQYGGLIVQDSTGALTTFSSAGSQLSSAAGSGAAPGQMVIDHASGNVSRYFYGCNPSGNALVYGQVAPTTDTILNTNFSSSANHFDRVTGIAPAHSGSYWTGIEAGKTTARLARYNEAALTEVLFPATQVLAPTQIASVLAPEPSSLVAGLLGLALLSRRRRR